MSPTRLFQRYKIEIAFIFAILVLLAAGLGSYRALESARSSAGWVRHTYQVIGTIDELVEALAMVHSSYRSFALTGDEQQLALNRSAAERATATRNQLSYLIRDNPEQQQRLSEIERLSKRLMQRSDEVISTRRDKGAERALDLLRSGEGYRALEQFRRVTGALKDGELQLLEAREQQANDAFKRTQLALAAATLLALVLTAAAGLGTLRDIRRRQKAEADLFLEKERAQVTLASIGDGVMRADVAGNVTFLNRAGTVLTGWSDEEAAGRPLADVFPLIDAATRTPIVHRLQEALRRGELMPLPETALLVRRDGKEVPIEDTVAPIRDKEGNFTGAVNVFRDVSEAREATRRLRHGAHHDALTGLPNRVLLDDRIGRAISTAERHGGKVAVLYLDLDGFKLINDTQGHAVGDKLLQLVTARLLACVRDCDTVCRIGGDEFVVLLPKVVLPEDAATTARRILDCMNPPHAIDGRVVMVTASIGISLYPDDARSAGDLLANADAAMYEAKSSGRAGFVFFPAADAAEKGAQRRA
jgi:diguanylate cyclase (GGDEF)-like protein/PAS domain S-box-containing protein